MRATALVRTSSGGLTAASFAEVLPKLVRCFLCSKLMTMRPTAVTPLPSVVSSPTISVESLGQATHLPGKGSALRSSGPQRDGQSGFPSLNWVWAELILRLRPVIRPASSPWIKIDKLLKRLSKFKRTGLGPRELTRQESQNVRYNCSRSSRNDGQRQDRQNVNLTSEQPRSTK